MWRNGRKRKLPWTSLFSGWGPLLDFCKLGKSVLSPAQCCCPISHLLEESLISCPLFPLQIMGSLLIFDTGQGLMHVGMIRSCQNTIQQLVYSVMLTLQRSIILLCSPFLPLSCFQSCPDFPASWTHAQLRLLFHHSQFPAGIPADLQVLLFPSRSRF